MNCLSWAMPREMPERTNSTLLRRYPIALNLSDADRMIGHLCVRHMKTKFSLIAIVVCLLLILAAFHVSFASAIFSTSRDWQFVQSVGGLTIGPPDRDSRKHVILPVRCDVSGLQTITVRPTALNSGFGCDIPAVRIRSTNVLITLRTKLVGNGTALCPSADLGRIADGDYAVFYRNPDGKQNPLGTIHVTSP
jgi:hypothetical protein